MVVHVPLISVKNDGLLEVIQVMMIVMRTVAEVIIVLGSVLKIYIDIIICPNVMMPWSLCLWHVNLEHTENITSGEITTDLPIVEIYILVMNRYGLRITNDTKIIVVPYLDMDMRIGIQMSIIVMHGEHELVLQKLCSDHVQPDITYQLQVNGRRCTIIFLTGYMICLHDRNFIMMVVIVVQYKLLQLN